MNDSERSERIKLVEERLEVAKREVERGRVVVRTRVEERDERVFLSKRPRRCVRRTGC